MAVRLGDYVLYGEFRNLQRFSTHGFVVLRGVSEEEATLVRFSLNGDCDADLRGKCFRFMPRDEDQATVFRLKDYRISLEQIGPTGVMTSQGWVRHMPCSVEEFLRRKNLGEPPPTPWVRHLYLEWYGQSGRGVIEMEDPIVEECVREPEDDEDEGDWVEIPNLAVPPEYALGGPPPGIGISMIRLDEDMPVTEDWIAPAEDEPETCDPGSLQWEMDREAAAIDRAIAGMESDDDEDATDAIAECELMDYCMEHAEGQSLASLLGDTDKLPRPETLDDAGVESHLKVLLARMAMFNVALDMCEHYTPRDAYRLLLDTILHESETYVELVGSSWVTHVMTHEYCDACEAEIAAECEGLSSNEEATWEPGEDDDVPF